MGQSNVGIRLTVDAGQAKSEFNDLGRTVSDLKEKLKAAMDAKDMKESAQILNAINSATSARGMIMSQHNQALAQQQQTQAQGVFGGQNVWVFQQALNQITHGILTAWDAALTAAKQRASGDYTGATVSRQKGIEGAIGGGIGAVGTAMTLTLLPEF